MLNSLTMDRPALFSPPDGGLLSSTNSWSAARKFRELVFQSAKLFYEVG
jgi:hypothetical protein